MRRLVLALVLPAVVAAPAAAADEPVATLAAPTPLRAYRDVVVWSLRTPHGYQLWMRRGNAPLAQIPVAERERAGGFDVGGDAGGRPLLAYTRCARSCDIYTATLDGHERRIAAASAPSENEGHPAVSNGVLAWSRGPRLYTRRVSDPKRRASRLLLTLTRGNAFDELDVSGTRVAYLASRERRGRVGYLVGTFDARTAEARIVRRIGTGEGGQFVFGLGFHARRLGWAMSCAGDPSGCGAGAFRLRSPDGRIERTTSVSQAIGFTLAGPSAAYVLQGTRNEGGAEDPFLCPCRLEHRTSVSWR